MLKANTNRRAISENMERKRKRKMGEGARERERGEVYLGTVLHDYVKGY